MNDLFGNEVEEKSLPARNKHGRLIKYNGPKGGKNYIRAAGHAWQIGSGPSGETCGSCDNCVRRMAAGTFYKCILVRERWTGGRKTDVLLKDAACKFWKSE